MKKKISIFLSGLLLIIAVLAGGCGSKAEQLVIYSNADEEAMTAIKNALDQNGFKDQYILQSFGTSELGGKLLAEGSNIEADMVTMSSFYLESAQTQNKMFRDLTFELKALQKYPAYYAPITAQEGAIIVNTEALKENNLIMPLSIKDLGKPEYKDMLSVIDIKSSSTAWLLIQGLVSAHGEDETAAILGRIYDNAGPHIEDSGSGPIKKLRAGETAIGFGLRHQAVADKEKGLPIDYVDPAEGNFSLTESVAVIEKGDKSNPLAMQMAECIIKNSRKELIQTYPIPIYEGEQAQNMSANPKVFDEPLTADLLKKHQELSESCK